MKLADANIFFDNLGRKTLKLGHDIDFGANTDGTTIIVENSCFMAGHDMIDCDFIGAYTFINMHVTIRHTASIGRFCSIAPDVYIGLADHPTEGMSSSNFFYGKEAWSFTETEYDYKAHFNIRKEKITIGNDVWIGMGAKILRGIHIGDGAIIGAGAVVTKDVPPYTIWGGVPAKMIKYRFDEEIRKRLLDIKWWEYEPDVWNGLPIGKMNLQLLSDMEKRKMCKKIQPVCYRFQTKEQKITRICGEDENMVYDMAACKICEGGISQNKSCQYRFRENLFQIKGWFLPSYAYDTVEIWTNKRYLGNARLHVLRTDVAKNFLAYGDARAGWEFISNIKLDSDEIEAVVRCKKNGRIIHETRRKIFPLSVEAFLTDFRVSDTLEKWSGIKEVAFETDENEGAIKRLLQREFEKINISVTDRAERRIICKLNMEGRGMDVGKNIPFYCLLAFANGAIDYSKVKMIAMNMNISIEEVMYCVRSWGENRTMICCYGNCQILSINSLLLTSDKIKREYDVLLLPPVQSFDVEEKDKGLPEAILKEIGIFIYQNVSEGNKFSRYLSTENVKRQLKEECVCLAIPNIYFKGYFPQYCENQYNPKDFSAPRGPFPYGDTNIQNMWDEYTPEKIAEILSGEDFYSEEVCKKSARDSMEELRAREEVCDIRISDYLENGYRDVRMFYTPNHVCNFVLKELIDRVFQHLGICIDDIDIEKSWENESWECFIYPSVAKNLELKFAKDKYCYFRQAKEEPSTMKEYVRDYIRYCKPR